MHFIPYAAISQEKLFVCSANYSSKSIVKEDHETAQSYVTSTIEDSDVSISSEMSTRFLGKTDGVRFSDKAIELRV